MVLCAHKPTHITPTSGCPRWCESGRWSQVTGHRVVLGKSKNTVLPREPGPLPPSTWGRNRPFMFTENRTGQKQQAGLLPSGACPAPAPLHAAELPPQWDLASQGSLASQGAIVTPRRRSSKMERKNKNRELEISDLWRQTEIQEKSAYLHYFPIGQYFIDPNYHCICNIFFLFKSFFHYFFSFVCFFNFCFKQVRIISMRKS